MNIALNTLLAQLSLALDAVEEELLGASPGHGKRVGLFCLAMGRHLGYDHHRLFDLACCALLHDNALTEYILSEKPGRGQLLHLESHCRTGQENLSYLPLFSTESKAILHHHERADGRGPYHRKEGCFSQEAALICLADRMDVQFRLHTQSAGDLSLLREHIERHTGTRYTADAGAAGLAVLEQGLLENMQETNLKSALGEAMPQISRKLDRAQALQLSYFIAKIIDYKSEFTRKHTLQIANKSWVMSGCYGYPEDLRVKIYLAAALHDIGKLFIPSPILEKPGRLTTKEFDVIKTHVRLTWELLHGIEGLEDISQWASNHHEKLDGSGYPFGLTGDKLDFISRLLACLDIYQAVSEKRPYHSGRSHEETMAILWDMAHSGLIDASVTADLGTILKGLPDGNAPLPDRGTGASVSASAGVPDPL